MKTLVLFFLVVFQWTGMGQAAPLEKVTLTKEMSLLDGRLTLIVPREVEQDTGSYDLMAVPSSDQQQTRIKVKNGFTIVVTELFAKKGGDFDDAVDRYLNSTAGQLGKLKKGEIRTTSDGLSILPFQPEGIQVKEGGDPVFVRGLLVINKDQTLQQILFIAEQPAFQELKGLQVLIDRMVAGLKAGTRSLGQSSRPAVVAQCEKKEMAVQVPEGYAYVVQRGLDFDVQRVVKIKEFGTGAAYLGFYKGTAPDDSFKDGSTPSKGKLMGQPVEWFKKTETSADGKDRDFRQDALVPISLLCGSKEDGSWMLHLFSSAPSEGERAELWKIAESLGLMEK